MLVLARMNKKIKFINRYRHQQHPPFYFFYFFLFFSSFTVIFKFFYAFFSGFPLLTGTGLLTGFVFLSFLTSIGPSSSSIITYGIGLLPPSYLVPLGFPMMLSGPSMTESPPISLSPKGIWLALGPIFNWYISKWQKQYFPASPQILI